MQTKPKTLICVGSPLLDLSIEVNSTFIARHDYQLNNTYRVKSDDQIFSYIIESQNYNKIAGGQTLNSLRVAQWMFPNHKSQFIGSVGDDLYAKLLIESCLNDNVEPIFEVLPAAATGKCAVLLSNRDRCLVTSLGASGDLTEKFVDSYLKQISQADLFLGEVYFLYANPELNKKVFKICCEKDLKVCLALGAVNAIKDNFVHLKELFPFVDYVFGNRNEFEELARQYKIEFTDIEELGQEIAKLEKVNNKRQRVCVITQKSCPIVAKIDKIEQFHVNPLDSLVVVDTNSAGDAFCGGFIGQLVNYNDNDIDFSKCISAGHYAALQIIQQIGCTLPKRKCEFQ